MAVVTQPTLRRRTPRLGTLTLALIALTLCLSFIALRAALSVGPGDSIGRIPVAAKDAVPSVAAILAVLAAAAAVVVGLAALHAAAAMRVLARDRPAPDRLPRELRRLRAFVLAPLGPASAQVLSEPVLPPSELPAADGPACPRLRLTVLVPAYNEGLTLGATLESLWGQTRPPDKVVVVADNCSDDTEEVARRHGAEVFTTVHNGRRRRAGSIRRCLRCSRTSIEAMSRW